MNNTHTRTTTARAVLYLACVLLAFTAVLTPTASEASVHRALTKTRMSAHFVEGSRADGTGYFIINAQLTPVDRRKAAILKYRVDGGHYEPIATLHISRDGLIHAEVDSPNPEAYGAIRLVVPAGAHTTKAFHWSTVGEYTPLPDLDAGKTLEETRQGVADFINDLRVQRGLSPVTLNVELSDVLQGFVAEVAAGNFEHNAGTYAYEHGFVVDPSKCNTGYVSSSPAFLAMADPEGRWLDPEDTDISVSMVRPPTPRDSSHRYVLMILLSPPVTRT